jgi:putative tryptophan/tyrosine transport system substrate-binding protein
MAVEHQGLPVSRRRFMQGAGAAGLGLVAGCGRLPWQAVPPTKVYRIGVLAPSGSDRNVEALRTGLREQGYVEGQNLTFEFRSGDGNDGLPAVAAELVGLNVDLIFAMGGAPARAAKLATETIPIVFGVSTDPVPSLAASWARPGGNATGVIFASSLLAGKRLELLREIAPTISRVAVLWQPAHRDTDFIETEAAAQALGVELLSLEVHRPDELPSAFDAASQWRAEGLIIVASPFMTANAPQIVALATQQRLPTVSQWREFAEAGAVLTYGPNRADSFRRATYFVDRILKGTKPADLPVEQPTRFEVVVNLKAARLLGLTIPQHILLQATEVIQ